MKGNKTMHHKLNLASRAGATALLAAGLLIAAIPFARAHGPDAHGAAAVFGVPGDAGKPSRLVEIVLSDADGKMMFQPSNITAKAGEQLRFRVHNEGVLEHEFILATREANLKHAEEMRKNPEMEHDEPNMQRLKPNETKEVLWRFTNPGIFHIGCLIPGHLESGMEANVVVTASNAKAK